MLQLISDWELHVLVLLSFALQIFLFFSGGLRRRNNHLLLRITTWISYISADFIAAYTLGRLSRNLPATEEKHTHELTILWAPFLLIHLGGQDTVTAFSLEDNELWLRHLLNLVGQACLVLYVLWKWVALALYRVVIPAAFLFVAGSIKYGERIWALKLGSQNGLRASTSRDVTKDSLRAAEEVEIFSSSRPGYKEIILHALQTEQCVRYLFAGKKLDMLSRVSDKFLNYEDGGAAEVSFKRVEIELSIMYDSLFTKSRVVQTRPGSILRCVSIASTVVAFALYVVKMVNFDYHTRRSRVDASITYILFIGAFCLEAFSMFVRMMSPWQWPAILEAGRCCGRGAWLWPIFTRIHPETKPWWSNSMGQYNLIESRRSVDSKWSSSTLQVMAKMAGVFGAREWWNKKINTKHAPVTSEVKELINDSIGYGCIPVPHPYGLLFKVPFEEALVSLHLWTDVVMHKAAAAETPGRDLEAAAATQGRDLEAAAGTQSQDQEAAAESETQAPEQEAAAATHGGDQEAAAATQGRDLEAAAATQAPEQEAAAATQAPHHEAEVRRRLMDTSKTLSNYMMYLLVEHPSMLPGRTNIQDLMERSFLQVINGATDKADKEEEDIFESLAKGYGGPGWDFWRQQKMELAKPGGIHEELVILEKVWVRMLLYAAAKCRPDEHARRLSTGVELITFVWLLMAHQSLGDADTTVSLTTTTGDATSTDAAAVYLMGPLPPPPSN
jgi:hypothetical protein